MTKYVETNEGKIYKVVQHSCNKIWFHLLDEFGNLKKNQIYVMHEDNMRQIWTEEDNE